MSIWRLEVYINTKMSTVLEQSGIFLVIFCKIWPVGLIRSSRYFSKIFTIDFYIFYIYCWKMNIYLMNLTRVSSGNLFLTLLLNLSLKEKYMLMFQSQYFMGSRYSSIYSFINSFIFNSFIYLFSPKSINSHTNSNF